MKLHVDSMLGLAVIRKVQDANKSAPAHVDLIITNVCRKIMLFLYVAQLNFHVSL